MYVRHTLRYQKLIATWHADLRDLSPDCSLTQKPYAPACLARRW